MTPEEAQIIIGNIPIKPEVLDDCYDITEYQEAKTMAIKALEEVSRLPENLHREREQAYMNGYADAKSTCRWISVDERLPEERYAVLVWCPERKNTYCAYLEEGQWWIFGAYFEKVKLEVTAWMPLPEWEGMEYDEERNTMKIKKSAYDDAIERIDKSTFTLNDGLDCVETLVAMEAVMIASRQTKPCEDCISREAVKDILHKRGQKAVITFEHFEEFVNKLPSVTPQPKIGRWIRWYEVIESADGKSTDHIPHCKCSECGTEYEPHSSQFIKYCPNCGAKMEENENDK